MYIGRPGLCLRIAENVECWTLFFKIYIATLLFVYPAGSLCVYPAGPQRKVAGTMARAQASTRRRAVTLGARWSNADRPAPTPLDSPF
jgi:hypothetical protein